MGHHQTARPAKWTWYYLYVILDIYSRYVVGWMVAHREAAALAERLLADTIANQGVEPGMLNVHADRGTSMTAKPVAMLLADLGVTKSHSRPHVSNDNPYSESQFKTLKHHPNFPDRFGSIQDARSFCQGFLGWYNHEHRHSGIALLTPADVHHGRTNQVITARAAVLDGAYAAHPGAVRPQATHAAPAARGGLDQQAHRPNAGASAIPRMICLTEVDRLRVSWPAAGGCELADLSVQ
jgi:putative transposase